MADPVFSCTVWCKAHAGEKRSFSASYSDLGLSSGDSYTGDTRFFRPPVLTVAASNISALAGRIGGMALQSRREEHSSSIVHNSYSSK